MSLDKLLNGATKYFIFVGEDFAFLANNSDTSIIVDTDEVVTWREVDSWKEYLKVRKITPVNIPDCSATIYTLTSGKQCIVPVSWQYMPKKIMSEAEIMIAKAITETVKYYTGTEYITITAKHPAVIERTAAIYKAMEGLRDELRQYNGDCAGIKAD